MITALKHNKHHVLQDRRARVASTLSDKKHYNITDIFHAIFVNFPIFFILESTGAEYSEICISGHRIKRTPSIKRTSPQIYFPYMVLYDADTRKVPEMVSSIVANLY